MVNSRSSSVWNRLSLSPKAVPSIIDGIWIFKVRYVVEMVDSYTLSDVTVACFRRFPIYVTGVGKGDGHVLAFRIRHGPILTVWTGCTARTFLRLYSSQQDDRSSETRYLTIWNALTQNSSGLRRR
jgi:hypothetical protein